MKAIYLFLIFISFCACQKLYSYKQGTQNTDSKVVNFSYCKEKKELIGDTSAIIAQIRAEYQLIKNDSANNSHQILEAECENLFGEIKFQSSKTKIRRIAYSYGSDHGSITEEYYLRNDSLLFVFAEEGRWNFDPETTDSETPKIIDEITETRYYFHHNQLIRVLRKHAKGSPDKIEKLLETAKNETLKGEKANEWLKKVQELKTVLKTRSLSKYMCK